MKIMYDEGQETYAAKLEDSEMVTLMNTDDIVEARKYFIENMISLFNNAVREQINEGIKRQIKN